MKKTFYNAFLIQQYSTLIIMPKRSLISLILSLVIGSAFANTNDICNIRVSEVGSASGLGETVTCNHKSYDSISRNIFIELGGPSLGVGIGYDQRFTPTSVFGFHAGLSYTSGSWNNFDYGDYEGADMCVDFKGMTVPLEVNVITGRRASKFEIGVGATPCILHRHEVKYRKSYLGSSIKEVKDGSRINIFGTLNIGYRLQRKSGFFLRAGLSYLIGDIKCSPFDGAIILPNISLGCTIR